MCLAATCFLCCRPIAWGGVQPEACRAMTSAPRICNALFNHFLAVIFVPSSLSARGSQKDKRNRLRSICAKAQLASNRAAQLCTSLLRGIIGAKFLAHLADARTLGQTLFVLSLVYTLFGSSSRVILQATVPFTLQAAAAIRSLSCLAAPLQPRF